MSWVRVPSDTQAERSFKKGTSLFCFYHRNTYMGRRLGQAKRKNKFFRLACPSLVVTLHLQTIYCEKNTFFALCPGFGDSSDVPADKRSNRLAASESADVCSRKRVLLFLWAHRHSHSRPPHKRRCGVQLWDVRLEETSLRVELHHGAY